jgi:hypothetical protein
VERWRVEGACGSLGLGFRFAKRACRSLADIFSQGLETTSLRKLAEGEGQRAVRWWMVREENLVLRDVTPGVEGSSE